MGFGIMELLFALIVLGMGYIVLQSAGRPDAALQGLGKLIGRIMIGISTILILLNLSILTTVIVRVMTGQKMQVSQQDRAVRTAPAPRPAPAVK